MKSPKSFTEVIMNGLCQYIEGDIRVNATFCPEKPIKGSVYCEEHHKKCRQPNPKKDLINQYDRKNK